MKHEENPFFLASHPWLSCPRSPHPSQAVPPTPGGACLVPGWRRPDPSHPTGLIFPICCLNLPGAFFIPYLIFLFTCGIPVFFLETALGQYTSQGGVTAWRRICPLFEGEWGEPGRAWQGGGTTGPWVDER